MLKTNIKMNVSLKQRLNKVQSTSKLHTSRLWIKSKTQSFRKMNSIEEAQITSRIYLNHQT